MTAANPCDFCTCRHTCYEQFGQCSKFVDRRKIRRRLIELGIIREGAERDPEREVSAGCGGDD